MEHQRRLARSEDGKMIAGVCGGIAEQEEQEDLKLLHRMNEAKAEGLANTEEVLRKLGINAV
jgi:hypothetical protein